MVKAPGNVRAWRGVARGGTSFALATVAVATLSAQTPVTAFTHVAVVPMDSDRVLPDQTVLVQGHYITAMGPAAQVAVPVGARQIDGQGKFLMPGLADMHVHICQPPCLAETVSPTDIYPNLFPYIANGVTTVRDMHSGNAGSPLLEVRRAVASGQVLGPRIYTAGDPEPYLTGNFAADTAAISTAALKAAGHDFVKLYGWRDSVYDSVVAAAHRVHLPIVGHAPAYRKIESLLNDHWASFEHLMGYLEYAMGLDGQWDEAGLYGMDFQSFVDTAAWMRPTYAFPDQGFSNIAAATKQAGVWNCPTLLVNSDVLTYIRTLDAGDPDTKANIRVMERLQEFAFKITKHLQDAGAGLLLGTDVLPPGMAGPIARAIPGFSVHHELQLLVQAGLTPYQALATGTRNVADFLGTADSTGTVAVGKRADLVLLDGNPLQDIRATRGPAGVMVGGSWLPSSMLDSAKAQVVQQYAGYPEDLLKQLYPELIRSVPP